MVCLHGGLAISIKRQIGVELLHPPPLYPARQLGLIIAHAIKGVKQIVNPQIGHVHLKVSDLERSIQFYQDVLGMKLTQRYGSQAAFMSWGGYHHHLGLNTWQSKQGLPSASGTTGLFHFAVLFSSREALQRAVVRVNDHGIRIDGAADHGVSEAFYFRDPDGNGIELYWDRPVDEWPRDSYGNLEMVTEPIRKHEMV